MRKWLDNIFLKKYQESNSEVLFQARALIYILLGLTVLESSLFTIITRDDARPLLLIMIGLNIGLLFLVRAGHLKIGCAVTIIGIDILGALLVFTNTFTNNFEVYQLAYLQIFILFITLLLSSSRIYPIVVMGIGVIAVIADYIFRAYPAQLLGKRPDIDDFIISGTLLVFAMIIVINTNKRKQSILNIAREEARLNKEKAENQGKILQDLKDSFNTGDQLVDAAEKVFNYIEEIRTGTQVVRDELNTLVSGTTRLREAGSSIAKASSTASDAAKSQAAIIEESSAAVSEMAASINNISGTATNRKTSIENLTRDSELANQAVSESLEAMLGLNRFITSLEEINDVIKGVSSQTSLLAMNAAIEAAHAGEMGKGFAVVADEVRKLSDNSSENVKMIAVTLKQISLSIKEAGAINTNAEQAYKEMHGEIKNVTRGIDEILHGIRELSAGTSQINVGTTRSVEITGQVKNAVTTVNALIQEMTKEFTRLEEVTASVFSALEVTLNSLTEVQRETTRVKQVGIINADNLKALGERLRGIG